MDPVGLGGEIVRQVLEAIRIGQAVVHHLQHRREAHAFVAPGALLLNDGDGRPPTFLLVWTWPHMPVKRRDDILEAPEEVIGGVERLPRWRSPGLPCWPMNRRCRVRRSRCTAFPRLRNWSRPAWRSRGLARLPRPSFFSLAGGPPRLPATAPGSTNDRWDADCNRGSAPRSRPHVRDQPRADQAL